MKKINFTNPDISKFQDEVGNEFDGLPTKYPLISGQNNLVEVAIGTGDTIVNHGLKRPVQGFLVVRKQAQTDVWESTTSNAQPQNQIILKASVAATVTLYFF